MDLFARSAAKRQVGQPLAERMRPRSLEELVGQHHLIGPGRILSNLSPGRAIPSLILWGPPGSGKTTLARLLGETLRADLIALSAVPLMSTICLVAAHAVLRSPQVLGPLCWLPFAFVVTVFTLGGIGLAYSLYPFVVIDRMTIWQAASATESLAVILVGCAVTVPAIALYTIYAYRVFWGKARALDYA